MRTTPKRLDPQSPSTKPEYKSEYNVDVKRARLEQRATPTSVHQGQQGAHQAHQTPLQVAHQPQQVSQQQTMPVQQTQPLQQNIQRQPISQAHNYNRQNSQTMVTRSEAYNPYQIR